MLYQRSTVFRRVFVVIVSILTIILLVTVFKDEIRNVYHPQAIKWQCSGAKSTHYNHRNGLKRLKQILLYTSWFGQNPWPLGSELSKHCPRKCVITHDKCKLSQSDAIVFHEPDLVSSSALERIAKYLGRRTTQRWVYYTHENPQNAKHKPALFNGIFNWTITYRRDSDIFYPYLHYRNIRPGDQLPTKTNYAKGKKGLIVWAASHCNLWRDEVVKNLLNYLPVTIIGKCGRLFKNAEKPTACEKRTESCSDYFRTFKFYLAFENGLCFDYITEKYWRNSLNYDMVPIVLGSDYDASVAIPGSYINVLDFKNIQELVKYLKYLDKNDTAYNEYFKWRKKYVIAEPEKSWICSLCENLYNDSLPTKVYDNLGSFWGVESTCNRREWKVKRLLD